MYDMYPYPEAITAQQDYEELVRVAEEAQRAAVTTTVGRLVASQALVQAGGE